MRIVKANNQSALDFIKDKISSVDHIPAVEVEKILRAYFVNSPNNVFLMLVLDGNDVVSFIIALAPPKEQVVFLNQLYVAEGFEHAKGLLIERKQLLLDWMDSIKRTEIRATTTQISEEDLRSLGFKEVSKVYAICTTDTDGPAFEEVETVVDDKPKE